MLSADRQTVTVELTEAGQKTVLEFELQGSFKELVDLSVLQAFQMEKLGEKYVLYMNDRLVGEFASGLSGGRIGYFAEGGAFFGFIGGSDYSGGKSICAYEKPVPGVVQGVDYENSTDAVRIMAGERGGESALLKAGDYAEYRIRVAESREYCS